MQNVTSKIVLFLYHQEYCVHLCGCGCGCFSGVTILGWLVVYIILDVDTRRIIFVASYWCVC